MATEIRIDRSVCMGSGNCAFWAPTVFDQDDEGIAIVVEIDEAEIDRIMSAVQGCPTQAISVTSSE
ncbi:MAG: ferredoxin [Acidimicrobiia bacterium]